MDADTDDGQPHTFLDAGVRFGSDAGAARSSCLRPRGGLVYHADTLVIPLLVPDASGGGLVAERGAGEPVHRSVGLDGAQPHHRRDALRRIRDARWTICAATASPKDVDMSWTRLTVWRAMLASMLDQPPHLPVSGVRVTGQKDYLPMDLLAAWLSDCA